MFSLLLFNIYLYIITGSRFDDPIVDMNDSSENLVLQSNEKDVNENVLDDTGDGSDEDDDDHSHAEKTPSILCSKYFNFSFHINNYDHTAVKKDFPLDEKNEEDDSDEDDDDHSHAKETPGNLSLQMKIKRENHTEIC